MTKSGLMPWNSKGLRRLLIVALRCGNLKSKLKPWNKGMGDSIKGPSGLIPFKGFEGFSSGVRGYDRTDALNQKGLRPFFAVIWLSGLSRVKTSSPRNQRIPDRCPDSKQDAADSATRS